jgi:hypothetical protein
MKVTEPFKLTTREEVERFQSLLSAYACAWGALVDAKLATEPALSSEAVFFPRLDMHRYSTSYILRYRALWANVMRFVILFFAPHRYDELANAKSQRRTFSNIATHAIVPPEFLQTIDSLLSDFDDRFRSPEAHGTGSLRKWSLSSNPGDNNPQISRIKSWNALSLTLIMVGAIFDPEQLNKLIHPEAGTRPYTNSEAQLQETNTGNCIIYYYLSTFLFFG